MKKLHQLEIEETEEKEKLRMDARDTLDKWYSDRKNRIEQRRKQNREDEAEYLRKRQEFK